MAGGDSRGRHADTTLPVLGGSVVCMSAASSLGRSPVGGWAGDHSGAEVAQVESSLQQSPNSQEAQTDKSMNESQNVPDKEVSAAAALLPTIRVLLLFDELTTGTTTSTIQALAALM